EVSRPPWADLLSEAARGGPAFALGRRLQSERTHESVPEHRQDRSISSCQRFCSFACACLIEMIWRAPFRGVHTITTMRGQGGYSIWPVIPSTPPPASARCR